MCSSFGIRDSDFCDPRCRLLSIECRLIRVTGVGQGRQDATMPVGGVLAETDINSEHELREQLG